MTGKGFDLSELILKNMMEVYEGQATAGLPYGCLLTRIFHWYGVEFNEEDKYVVKEFLDKKCLSASRLELKTDGTLIQLEPLPPPLPSITTPLTVTPDSEWGMFAKEIREGMRNLEKKMDNLTDEVKFFRDLMLGSRTANPSTAATPQNLAPTATTGSKGAPAGSLPTATDGLDAETKSGAVPVDENKEENDDNESA